MKTIKREVMTCQEARRLLWWDIKEWLANYNTAIENS